MCLHAHQIYHIKCNHLTANVSSGPGHVPPRYCITVQYQLFLYHSQPEFEPMQVPVPSPRPCTMQLDGSNTYVEYRYTMCEPCFTSGGMIPTWYLGRRAKEGQKGWEGDGAHSYLDPVNRQLLRSMYETNEQSWRKTLGLALRASLPIPPRPDTPLPFPPPFKQLAAGRKVPGPKPNKIPLSLTDQQNWHEQSQKLRFMVKEGQSRLIRQCVWQSIADAPKVYLGYEAGGATFFSVVEDRRKRTEQVDQSGVGASANSEERFLQNSGLASTDRNRELITSGTTGKRSPVIVEDCADLDEAVTSFVDNGCAVQQDLQVPLLQESLSESVSGDGLEVPEPGNSPVECDIEPKRCT